MISLNTDSKSTSIGRPPQRTEITTSEAHALAQQLMQRKLPDRIYAVLDKLAIAGVMSVSQLGIPLRTLQRYSKELRIIDSLSFTNQQVANEMRSYGFLLTDAAGVALFTLSPVGMELIKFRHPDMRLAVGYLAYPIARVMHDIIVNEIVLRIFSAVQADGWEVFWAGKYESSLYAPGEISMLEPDARIALRKGGKEIQFCIEYHNEDKQTRAWNKVDKYEAAAASEAWRSQWEADQFPAIIFVFKNDVVAKGYQARLTELGKGTAIYCGKRLDGVLSGAQPLDWMRVNDMQRVNILTGGKVAPAGETFPQAGE